MSLLLMLASGCNKKDNPVQAGTDTSTPSHILIQKNGDSILTVLLTQIDTAKAKDSLVSILLSNSDVKKASAGSQGVSVEYKNGYRGFFLIDPEDKPTGLSLPKIPLTNLWKKNSILTVAPTNPNTIIIDPIYSEWKEYSDYIKTSLDNTLPTWGFNMTTLISDQNATLDAMTKLSSYALVFLYSHGVAYPNKTALEEVYFLLKEERSSKSDEKYKSYLSSGDIVFVSGKNKTTYAVSPKFFSNFNNFSSDNSIVYGSFCFSFLGSWPHEVNITSKSAVYVGYNWAVQFDWDARWAASLFNNLDLPRANGPMNMETWFTAPDDITNKPYIYPRSYYSNDDKHTCSIQYTGKSDFAMWYGVKIDFVTPALGKPGDTVTVYGSGFQDAKGNSRLFYGKTEVPVISWNSRAIIVKIPDNAVSDSFCVNLRVGMFDIYSNKVSFTIGTTSYKINSINPAYTYYDDYISIHGDFGGWATDSVDVNINSYQVKGASIEDTTIMIHLKSGIPTGSVNISVVRNNIETNKFPYFIGLPVNVLNIYKIQLGMQFFIKGTLNGNSTSSFLSSSRFYARVFTVQWNGSGFIIRDTVNNYFTITGTFAADGQSVQSLTYDYQDAVSQLHFTLSDIPRNISTKPYGIVKVFECSNNIGITITNVSGSYPSGSGTVTVNGIDLSEWNFLHMELN